MLNKITDDHIGQLHTVKSLAKLEPALTEGGIRWTVFQFKNDLIEVGAIFYSGRKMMIDRNRYVSFLKGNAND